MNVDLTDAVFYNARGQEIPFQNFFVRARCIRYVHIPIKVPIVQTIKDMTTRKPRKQAPQKRTFKEKRVHQRQKETLQHLTRMYKK